MRFEDLGGESVYPGDGYDESAYITLDLQARRTETRLIAQVVAETLRESGVSPAVTLVGTETSVSGWMLRQRLMSTRFTATGEVAHRLLAIMLTASGDLIECLGAEDYPVLHRTELPDMQGEVRVAAMRPLSLLDPRDDFIYREVASDQGASAPFAYERDLQHALAGLSVMDLTA